MASSPTASRTEKASAAFRASFPNEEARRQHYAELGRRSGESKRASRDDSIVVTIRPVHELSPSQRQAWRELWGTLLAEPAAPEAGR